VKDQVEPEPEPEPEPNIKELDAIFNVDITINQVWIETQVNWYTGVIKYLGEILHRTLSSVRHHKTYN